VKSRIVCDASAVVAALLDGGADGAWAAAMLASDGLAAPAVVTYEAANVMRRHELGGIVSADQAAQAHADLHALAIELWPHELLASRAWELRHNLSIYDAAYVALAELLDGTLVTLDRSLARAPGIRCATASP
jgi:predicted nucleic acid-binding protein